MRTLILVRHAKAEGFSPDYTDLYRSLAPRGERDAPVMAARLRERLAHIDLLASSPAVRACATAGYFASEYGIPEGDILQIPRLYAAAREEYVKLLRSALPDASATVAVFAHNPATGDVVQFLSGQDLEDLPTCAVVRFEVRADSWSDLDPDVCRLCEVDTPKQAA